MDKRAAWGLRAACGLPTVLKLLGRLFMERPHELQDRLLHPIECRPGQVYVVGGDMVIHHGSLPVRTLAGRTGQEESTQDVITIMEAQLGDELRRRIDESRDRGGADLSVTDTGLGFTIEMPRGYTECRVVHHGTHLAWVDGRTIIVSLGAEGPLGAPLSWMQLAAGDRQLRRDIVPVFLDRGWSVQRNGATVLEGRVGYLADIEMVDLDGVAAELLWLAQQTRFLILTPHWEAGERPA